jgi:hypothetical protein
VAPNGVQQFIGTPLQVVVQLAQQIERQNMQHAAPARENVQLGVLARQDIQHAAPARHALEPTVITAPTRDDLEQTVITAPTRDGLESTVITVVAAVQERDLPPAIARDDETQTRGVINRLAALTFINEMEMGGAIVGRGRITTVRQDGGADTTHGSDDSEDSEDLTKGRRGANVDMLI